MFSYHALFLQFPLFQFFNYELLVTMSFFFFLLFALLQEKGQLGSYFKELSIEARSKFSRHLDSREDMISELSLYLDRSISKMRKILLSYEVASKDILFYLQYIIKKLSYIFVISRVKSYLENVDTITRHLSLQIRHYLTHDLFMNSFKSSKNQQLLNNSSTRRRRIILPTKKLKLTEPLA